MNTKRLMRDVNEVVNKKHNYIRALDENSDNLQRRSYLLLPSLAPYNLKAFKVLLEFENYPQKAPKVKIGTPMYHPNVRNSGEVCLAILTDAGWKAGTTIMELLEEILKLINEPQLDRPANEAIAAQYQNNREQFNIDAKAHVERHGEPRPQ